MEWGNLISTWDYEHMLVGLSVGRSSVRVYGTFGEIKVAMHIGRPIKEQDGIVEQ